MFASRYTIRRVYPRRGLPLALELVNTQFAMGGQPRDGLQTPADLEEWLEANAAGFGDVSVPAATEALLTRFWSLRAALREIFASPANHQRPRADALATLNAVLAAAPRFARLDWEASGPHVRSQDLAQDPETATLAAIARSSLDLIGSEHSTTKVGQCQAPGCVLFFVRDARRKNWCSAACGNRGRVARHYLRLHDKASDTAPARPRRRG
jgi:predicted RNA-binding Zn ribbon-like protein